MTSKALGLSKEELFALVEWISFQEVLENESAEMAHRIALACEVIDDERTDYSCLYLTREDCMLLVLWYEKLPRKLLDRRDVDMHTVLCIHLSEHI